MNEIGNYKKAIKEPALWLMIVGVVIFLAWAIIYGPRTKSQLFECKITNNH